LLSTSILVALAGPVLASDVAVSFSGSSTVEGGARHVDSKHKSNFYYSPNQKSTAIYTYQQASIKAEGKQDTLTYGAVLRLQMVGNSDNGTGDFKSNRSYIYLDTDAGAVQLGSNSAVSKMLKIDAGTIASGTGGVDGDWGNFASFYNVINPSNVTYKGYSSISNMQWNGSSVAVPTSDAIYNIDYSSVITGIDTLSNRLDTGESYRKITYLSPRISGLQIGVSFAPDIDNNGQSDLLHKIDANGNGSIGIDPVSMYMGAPVRAKNIWSMALNYTNKLDDITLGFSAVADRGTATKQTLTADFTDTSGTTTTVENRPMSFHNLNTYAIGASVAAHGFTLAGSYQNDGNSLTLQGQDKFKANWWTTGLAYAYENFSTSVTYLEGKKGTSTQNIKTSLVSWGVDYQWVPGMKPFAEVTYAKMKPTSTNASDSVQKSTIFILGTSLKF